MLSMPRHPHPDWTLITDLGGPVKVAELMKLSKEGSVQRVQNWKYRGIPARVKLKHPELFLRKRKASNGNGGHSAK